MAKLTIGVMQHNLSNLTQQALDSLSRAYRPDYEVIVLDNGSNAENRAFLETLQTPFPIKKLYLPENKGTAGGWNEVFLNASSPFIYCLHSDARVWDKDMFEKLYLDFQLYDKVGAVACCTNYVATEMQRCYLPDSLKGDLISVSKLDNVSTMFSKEAWEAVGHFDESYIYGNYEDTDYFMQLLKNGYQLLIDRRVWAEHLGSKTFFAHDYQSALLQNRALFLKRWGHYPKEKIFKVLSVNG